MMLRWDGKKWLDFRYILEVKLVGFDSRLEVGGERGGSV